MQHAGRVDPAAEFCKQAKSTLSDVAAWAHPLQGAQLSLAVDASDHHVGGVRLAASGGGSATTCSCSSGAACTLGPLS